MQKIIVTGGLGFIGSNLIELLIYKKFINRIKKNYKFGTFHIEGRDLSKINFMGHLEDNDRWLTVSEHRPSMMSWICCIPKENKFK